MRRRCPEHGAHEAVLASDARFYWVSRGAAENRGESGGGTCGGGGCGCAPADPSGRGGLTGRNADHPGSAEQLSTCLALIEIVDSCNLACPTCFADSPTGSGNRVQARPLPELQDRIEAVLRRKGRLEILQFSGGEPTLHPQFFELVTWAQEHPLIDMVLINTNGVRIARDEAFLAGLARLVPRKGIQLYLQYDGPQEAGQRTLRGADCRALRDQALDRCGDIGLSVTLAMTVIPENLPYAWEAVQAGLPRPHVHGITFQPVFGSGRTSPEIHSRITAADVVLSVIDGSAGRLGAADFTPLPCGDPNCAIIGYLLRTGAASYLSRHHITLCPPSPHEPELPSAGSGAAGGGGAGSGAAGVGAGAAGSGAAGAGTTGAGSAGSGAAGSGRGGVTGSGRAGAAGSGAEGDAGSGTGTGASSDGAAPETGSGSGSGWISGSGGN